jgi:serine/threonine-protein phosphatase PGAM5
VEGARIEAAFRRYIHRADPEQEHDSVDILVCHGNVIRYFICRALQFPPEAWLRFAVHNGSITMLTVNKDGDAIVTALGEAGHLPIDKLTFN